MPQPFHIQLWKNKDKELLWEIRGDIRDDDWGLLFQFKDEAKRLFECGPVKNGINTEFKMHYDINDGVSFHTKLPSEDDIAVLLHRLRPFVLQGEKANFLRICGILYKYLDHPSLISVITHQKALYTRKDFQEQIKITLADTVINSDDILYKWLNAFEYHREVDKKEELEMLHQLLPVDSTRAIFISMIMDKVKAIIGIFRMIRHIEERDGRKYPFPGEQ